MPSLGLLLLKVLVYLGVVAIGAWRWGATLPNKALRVFLAGLARFALGAIVGIPAGLILRGFFHGDTAAGFYALFFTLRFLLWLLVLRVAFLEAPMHEVVGLALAGAVVNAALDLALPDTLVDAFRINFC